MNAQIQFTTQELLCLVGVLVLAFSPSLGMAFNIDAIARSFGANNADAGFVASVEMAAIAAGNLLSAPYLGRYTPHRIYLVAIGVIAFMNLVSIIAPDLAWLAAIRFVAGAALGVLVATVMTSAGRSATPTQTFGVVNASVGAMGIVVSFVLPRSMQLPDMLSVGWLATSADGLYATYTIAALLAYVLVSRTPAPPPLDAHTASHGVSTRNRWPALFGLGLAFFGHALLGIFLVRVGREAGLDAEAIGYVLMAGGAIAIVTPLATGFLGARLPSLPVVLLLLATIAALGIALPSMMGIGFMIVAPIFAALPIAIMPIFLGAATRADPTGRIVASHPAFVMLGSAIAPLIGGWLSIQGGFTVNGYVLALCILIAAALVWPLLRSADVNARAQTA